LYQIKTATQSPTNMKTFKVTTPDGKTHTRKSKRDYTHASFRRYENGEYQLVGFSSSETAAWNNYKSEKSFYRTFHVKHCKLDPATFTWPEGAVFAVNQ